MFHGRIKTRIELKSNAEKAKIPIRKPEPNIIKDWQSVATTVAARFQKVLEFEQWTDCKFLVGINPPRTEFNCHKIVLASSSPVFEALFFGGLKVKDEEIVTIPDIEAQYFKHFINYLYTDKLIISNVQCAGALLYMGQKYLIPYLEAQCVQYLEEHLSVGNLLRVLKISETFLLKRLRKQCIKLMCRSQPVSWWNDNLIQEGALSSNTLGQIIDLMSVPEDEMDFVMMIMKWAKNICVSTGLEPDSSNTRLVIDQHDLIKHIRFLRLSKETLLYAIKPLELLSEDEMDQIEKCIRRIETSRYSNENDDPDNFDVPEGFSPHSSARNAWVSSEQMFVRPLLSKKIRWLFRGDHFCTFKSHYRILITGFSMYSRIPANIESVHGYDTPYHLESKYPHSYEENLKIAVKNSDGKVISRLNYENLKTQFNSTIKIYFDKPFWVEAHNKYTIITRISRGQYPSYDLAKIIDKNSERLEFSEKYESQYDLSQPNSIFTASSDDVGLIVGLSCKRYLVQEDLIYEDDEVYKR